MEFSLLGGPLHRLGSRLGIVRAGTNTVPLGLALGLACWSVLLALAFIEGTGRQLFSLSAAPGHARLLVAIPLFFLCETLLDPRLQQFARFMVNSGIVPEQALPALQSEIARIRRWNDSWLPEAVCLLAALLLSLAAPILPLTGATAAYDPASAAAGPTLTGWWYQAVTLTLFRFLLFRWLWRLALWSHLLWRVSRLDLRLIPTHPDGVAGLAILEVVHLQFAPLIVAISAVESAFFAENISTGAMAFTAIYPALAVILVLDAVLFIGPLVIFAPRLWACRLQGLGDYMGFAARYVREFDRKWLGEAPPPAGPLGTADLQSLADLSNSVKLVDTMRMVPVSRRLLVSYGLAALVPMAPLLLLKYPLGVLVTQIFTRLAGL